jgi:ubiquitin C-terminal hydrolase
VLHLTSTCADEQLVITEKSRLTTVSDRERWCEKISLLFYTTIVPGALKAFVQSEELTDGNEWKCDGCKKKVHVRFSVLQYYLYCSG